jgi:uncharacterized protein
MMQVIKNLLALQERDRRLVRLREELSRIPPERQALTAQASQIQTRLEEFRLRGKQIEADRKELELEVEAHKQAIEKYSLQQYQTRKNEEYRALTHEIETCKGAISQLEDRILELMEQADQVQKQIQASAKESQAVRQFVEGKLGELAQREKELQDELAALEVGRAELAQAVDESSRYRYERMLKNKTNVVVGIQRGVCGGCHMTLQRQVVVSCQADHEVISCPNCGRILYFTPDMDTSLVE